VRRADANRRSGLIARAALAGFASLAVKAADQHRFGWEETLLTRLSGVERDGFEAAMAGL
jgi:hypothetical protein